MEKMAQGEIFSEGKRPIEKTALEKPAQKKSSILSITESHKPPLHLLFRCVGQKYA